MRNSKTNGFTLIELLIVIAIIGILAAVLIPNLLNARQRAFDTAAQTCLKEIVTAEEIAASQNPWEYAGTFAQTETEATADPYVGIASCESVVVEGGLVTVADDPLTTGVDESATDAFNFLYTGAHLNGSTTYQVANGSGVIVQP